MARKAKYVVIDAETYRTRDEAVIRGLEQEAMAKRPNTNTRKELKLTWDTEAEIMRRVEEALAKTSTDVLLAEILCVCVKADEDACVIQLSGMGKFCQTECLKNTAFSLSDITGPDTIWIGHNIAGFDLPLLLNRFRRHGVTPPEHFPVFTGRRWMGRVFDTMLRTPCQNSLGYVSLEDVCRAYGLPSAKSTMWNGAPMDGSRVGEAYEAGEYDLILEYCAADVWIEEQLYQRMTFDGRWGTYDLRTAVAEQIAEIDASGLDDTAMRVAKFNVLEAAGLVPRH